MEMPRTKIDKKQIWADLLELIGDTVEVRKSLENGLQIGERYTVVNGNKILIQALSLFSGYRKTVDINSMTIKRIQHLTEIIQNEGRWTCQ